MVNILFLPASAKVIELMNATYLNDAYYLMASSIEIPYYSVPCSMANPAIADRGDSVLINDADLLADLPQLENVIQLALHL
jgi:hypothetical protein